jgi:SOS regulatory protein LexA
MNLTPKQLRILQIIRDWRHRFGVSPTMQEIASHLGVSKVTIFEHAEALIAKGALERAPNKARALSIPDDVRVPGVVGATIGDVDDADAIRSIEPFAASSEVGSTARERSSSGRGRSGTPKGTVVGQVAERVVEHVGLRLPLVGKIAAGYPIEKFAQDDELSLEEIFGPKRGQRGNLFALQVDGDSMKDEGIFDGDYVIVERRDTARNGERVVALLPNGETTLKTLFREKDGTVRLQPANPEFKPIIVREVAIQGVVIGVLRRY